VVVRVPAIFVQYSPGNRWRRDTNGIYLRLLFHQDLAGPDLIKFGIESKKSCEETSTEAFIDAIALALQDMRDICVKEPNPPQPAARL